MKRNQAGILLSLLLAVVPSTAMGGSMPSTAAGALSTRTADRTTSAQLAYLSGHATLSGALWQQHLAAGLNALDNRLYDRAKAHLSAAIDEMRKHNISGERLLAAKNALGDAFLGEEQLTKAQRAFEDVATRARVSNDEEQLAAALSGLAETYLSEGQATKAESASRQALAAAQQAGHVESLASARAWSTLAQLLATQGLYEDSKDAYQHAVSILEHQQGTRYELAETLCGMAKTLRAMGKTDESATCFQHAFATIDGEARFQTPVFAAPRVTMRWDENSPRSHQIADPEYPLKYVLINGLRIAAVPVRSEHVIAVIVSLANCSRTRIPVAVGPVTFTQLAPRHKSFLHIDPEQLDLTLEEDHVTDLTWRRRWLNHIEKTRFIPGYLNNGILDADNFFGNNQFGEYGKWPTIARNDSAIVTREEFLYGKRPEPDPLMSSFLSHALGGYHPTYLDPGEAKTGLVFFLQERFDKAVLSVVVGNAVAEIPFDSAGPR